MNVTYEKVYDSRNRRMRGLWARNGVFYAQMRVEGQTAAVRYPLHQAPTVSQAVTEQQVLKKQKQDGTLIWPPPGTAKRLAEKASQPSTSHTLKTAFKAYRAELEALDSKKELTRRREKSGLKQWERYLDAEQGGDLSLTERTASMGTDPESTSRNDGFE